MCSTSIIAGEDMAHLQGLSAYVLVLVEVLEQSQSHCFLSECAESEAWEAGC